MGKIDRQKMAAAVERVVRRSNTEITEVIEKDEDKDLTLTDRFAATFAALLVCGLVYLVLWFGLLLQLGRVNTGAAASTWLWILSWHTPAAATILTGALAFFRPGLAYRHFGKVANAVATALGHLLTYWA